MSVSGYRDFLIGTLRDLEEAIGSLEGAVCAECGDSLGIQLTNASVSRLLLIIVESICERGEHYDNVKAKTKFDIAPRRIQAASFLGRQLGDGSSGTRSAGDRGSASDPVAVR